MEVSRRSFLKRGLLLGGGAASGLAGAAAHAAGGSKKPYKLTSVNETTNICCYCSGGCGTKAAGGFSCRKKPILTEEKIVILFVSYTRMGRKQ